MAPLSPPLRTSGLSAFLGFFLMVMGTLYPPPAMADSATVSHHASPPHAVILMYHRFGEARFPSTNVTLEQFDAHLNHLADHGYQVWPLSQVLEHLAHHRPLPDRTVVITVDDAYRSVYEAAYPRLKARGWPFAVFVATDGVDRGFRHYMTWEQMREMASHGASFFNHGASHDYLIRRKEGEDDADWRQRVQADIKRAERRLTEELGPQAKIFSYPYGEYDTALKKLVGQLGYTALGQHSGAVGVYADPQALARFPMAETFAGLADFSLKVATLPLPVRHATPDSPVIRKHNPPTLRVTLDPEAAIGPVNCFASGQGELVTKRLSKSDFTTRAPSPLPKGRSRYNCTARVPGQARFFWYSHLWIR